MAADASLNMAVSVAAALPAHWSQRVDGLCDGAAAYTPAHLPPIEDEARGGDDGETDSAGSGGGRGAMDAGGASGGGGGGGGGGLPAELALREAALAAVFRARALERDDREVPAHFTDPISFDLMLDPVVAPSGHSFERASIVACLKMRAECPITRTSLTSA
jgi:hypothetical protein